MITQLDKNSNSHFWFITNSITYFYLLNEDSVLFYSDRLKDSLDSPQSRTAILSYLDIIAWIKTFGSEL